MTTPDDTYDIRDSIRAVVEGVDLSETGASLAMNTIMDGNATGAQIGSLVTALRMKGETVQEIAGFARAMREHALRVTVLDDGKPLLDTCGTGGDHSNTFNISTTATFAIAASGVRIAKHGNRAASSQCGSADLLEALGVEIQLTPQQVAECVNEVGIGFMFAPSFHPAMRFAGPSRKEIGIRTVFNIVAPITNPASASHQLIGVGHPEIAMKLAEVLRTLGGQHAVLVHGDEGLDEVGIGGTTQVTEWDKRQGKIVQYTIAPEDFGLERATRNDIIGGDVAENIRITRSILSGEQGPRRTVTILNAGAGIYAADAATSIEEGIGMAVEAIDSGQALAKLDQLAATTQAFAIAAEG